jgi:dienelactone hydrolase
MIVETYEVSPGLTLGIEIAPAPADGKRHPVVVLIHGNFGLVAPFGDPLRHFTEEVAALGYVAALPSLYADGKAHRDDTADPTRLGLIGFSLGGGVAATYITSSPAGATQAFADFYGYVAPVLGAGVSRYPPTIIFQNKADPIVLASANSDLLDKALAGPPTIEHEYYTYDDNWTQGVLHAFEPGGAADTDSRDKTLTWLTRHMPPP